MFNEPTTTSMLVLTVAALGCLTGMFVAISAIRIRMPLLRDRRFGGTNYATFDGSWLAMRVKGNSAPFKTIPIKRYFVFAAICAGSTLVLSFAVLQMYVVSQLIQAGTLQAALKDYVGAERSFRRAVILGKMYRSPRLKLVEALLLQGKLKEAMPEARLVTETDPENAHALILFGDCLICDNRPAEAERVYRRTIAVAPRLAAAYCKLGDAFQRQGRINDAQAEYEYCITISPSNVEALMNLGFLLINHGQSYDGLTYLKRAVDENPNNVVATNAFGLACASQHMFEKASVLFQSAINIDPEFADGYFNLGSALKDMQETAGSLAAYRSYLRKCRLGAGDEIAISRACEEINRMQVKETLSKKTTGGLGTHTVPPDQRRDSTMSVVSTYIHSEN